MSRYQSRNRKFIRSSKKSIIKLVKFTKKNFVIFLINLLFFSGLIGWWYFGYRYWVDTKNSIKDVIIKFDEVAAMYDTSDIKETIKDRFIGMNKLYYKSISIIWKNIITKYNWVKDSTTLLSGNILYMDISWKLPDFIIVKDQIIANIVSNQIYSTTKNLDYYKFWTWYNTKLIYIKSAWYSTAWFSGVFYNISINTFVKQLEIITSALNDYKTVAYLPWGEKVEIEMENGQLLYFDIGKNTLEQINKYKVLKEKYNKFSNYKIIDLGTIEDQVFLK